VILRKACLTSHAGNFIVRRVVRAVTRVAERAKSGNWKAERVPKDRGGVGKSGYEVRDYSKWGMATVAQCSAWLYSAAQSLSFAASRGSPTPPHARMMTSSELSESLGDVPGDFKIKVLK
jgi:hypothetical protein